MTYQNQFDGAPQRIPPEPPEPQPSGLYLVNLPPIPYNPAPPFTGTQAVCPYIPFHVPDKGYFEEAQPAEVADYMPGEPAKVVPTYAANVVATLPLDQDDAKPPKTFSDTEGLMPTRQDFVAGVDFSIPQTPVSPVDQYAKNIYQLDVTNG